MKVTYYGHSCFQIEVGGRTLLFDPFISGNDATNGVVTVDEMKPDVILVTHGHGDHVGDTVQIAKNSGATVIANFEVASWLEKRGVENTIGINHGGAADCGGEVRARLVPAWHSSSLPDGSYGGVAGGFVMTHPDGAFYVSGDTTLFSDMALFAERDKLDMAFLCLGGHFTMDAEDAARAAALLKVKTVVGTHFDTFPPIAIDHDAAHSVFDHAGRKLILPEMGQAFEL